MFRPSEGSLGVDHPVLTEQRAQKSMESFLCAESLEASGKPQFAVTKRLLEPGDELSPKDAAQYFYRQEEGITWVHPVLVMERKTAGGNHTVDVLTAGVEH